MTNKLVVIVNSLKVPKSKKILLYEMKFLIPNCRCLQNPRPGGYCPQDLPFSLSSVLNWICWCPPLNKIPGYVTDYCHWLVLNVSLSKLLLNLCTHSMYQLHMQTLLEVILMNFLSLMLSHCCECLQVIKNEGG